MSGAWFRPGSVAGSEAEMLATAELVAAARAKTARNLLIVEKLLRLRRGERGVTVETLVAEEPWRPPDFAAGHPDGQGGFGMYAGPLPTARDVMGEAVYEVRDGDVLFEFGPDGARELYYYSEMAARWMVCNH